MSISSEPQLSLSLSKRKNDSRNPRYNVTQSRKSIRFQLPHNENVKNILTNYCDKEYIREFEQLVCMIRDNTLKDEEMNALIKEATQCISLLNQDLRLFVEAILILKWTNKSESVINTYRSFLINLLCAHNYHAKFALDQLVSNFYPEVTSEEWINGEPRDEDCSKLANIHCVLKTLLKVVPMCRELLHQSIITQYPYFKRPTHAHEYYIHNILWILDYQPSFKLDILNLIFNRLIVLDANVPREDILKAEEGQIDEDIFGIDDLKSVKSYTNSDCMRHPVAHTLDVCLDKIFNFIIAECHDLETGQLNWDQTKLLYQTMIVVFDKVILPTYNIHHVQFVMFFICSFKVAICETFLNHLWKKVSNPNVPSIHRQTAVAYVASLLARAAFIPLSVIKNLLIQIANWVHSYISTQDGLECVNSDVRVHAVFYSVCQALFYVIAFRHRDLVTTKKNITFLESLNLGKMVTSRLNPLKVCQPAIVQNFAAITRTYQLAYCYTVIEHNARSSMPTYYFDDRGRMTSVSSVLDSFFPFDPYLLKRSGQKLISLYLEYKDIYEDAEQTTQDDDDDFLSDQSMDISSMSNSRHSDHRFSYGASPGFKYKS